MHLLSASSLGSTGKEAVPLETAWNGYRQVLKGRFHRGTGRLTVVQNRIISKTLGVEALCPFLFCMGA